MTRASASRLHIVLGSASLAGYPQGGGHWSWFIQYLLGLRALGHRVTWFETLAASGDPARDRARVCEFFEQVRALGLADGCILAMVDADGAPFQVHGGRLDEIAGDADLI